MRTTFSFQMSICYTVEGAFLLFWDFFFFKQLTTAQQQQPMFAVTILGYITCQLHNLVLLLLNWFEQPGKEIRAVPPSRHPSTRSSRTCPPSTAPVPLSRASYSLPDPPETLDN